MTALIYLHLSWRSYLQHKKVAVCERHCSNLILIWVLNLIRVIFLRFHLPAFLFCSLPWNLQCPFVFLFMGWWAMLWPLLHFRHEACASPCLMSTAIFTPFKGKKNNHLCKQIMQIISWKVLQNTATMGYSHLCCNSLFTRCPGVSSLGCSRVVFPPL